ncbi:helix-turn-helix transcriptional regulator [Marivita sp. S0852]|uniref:helix-turn-helix domain-containing protein n=1 Tax=Marivita sp. S0852 TaxID=3373893 RepID=UPI003981B40A
MNDSPDQHQSDLNTDLEREQCDSEPENATFSLTTSKCGAFKITTYSVPTARLDLPSPSLASKSLPDGLGQGVNKSDAVTPQSHTLTPREKEVLQWAARGKTSWETAVLLDLSEKTVKFYLSNARKRLAVQNKTHAVAMCVSEGAFKL